jgi:hypothetical protein
MPDVMRQFASERPGNETVSAAHTTTTNHQDGDHNEYYTPLLRLVSIIIRMFPQYDLVLFVYTRSYKSYKVLVYTR